MKEYRTEEFILTQASDFLEPIYSRTPFTESRIVILADGSSVPVLLLLAIRQFGLPADDLATCGYFPFWLDGDPTNEQLSNVGLAQKQKRHYRRLKLGPATDPSYQSRWRAANAERLAEYAMRYKVRKLILALTERTERRT